MVRRREMSQLKERYTDYRGNRRRNTRENRAFATLERVIDLRTLLAENENVSADAVIEKFGPMAKGLQDSTVLMALVVVAMQMYGMSQAAALDMVGMDPADYRRIMDQRPELLQSARDQLIMVAHARYNLNRFVAYEGLSMALPRAVATLTELMGEGAKDHVRLKAAGKILELANVSKIHDEGADEKIDSGLVNYLSSIEVGTVK